MKMITHHKEEHEVAFFDPGNLKIRYSVNNMYLTCKNYDANDQERPCFQAYAYSVTQENSKHFAICVLSKTYRLVHIKRLLTLGKKNCNSSVTEPER